MAKKKPTPCKNLQDIGFINILLTANCALLRFCAGFSDHYYMSNL